jgi:hypothetical protein
MSVTPDEMRYRATTWPSRSSGNDTSAIISTEESATKELVNLLKDIGENELVITIKLKKNKDGL